MLVGIQDSFVNYIEPYAPVSYIEMFSLISDISLSTGCTVYKRGVRGGGPTCQVSETNLDSTINSYWLIEDLRKDRSIGKVHIRSTRG